MTTSAAPEPMAHDAIVRLNGSVDRRQATEDLSMTDLLHKVETLPVIEQSKGVLSGYYGISPDTAFDVLRRWSSQHNRKLRDISQLVVTAANERPSNRIALRLLFERLGS